jgi:hypothetical protein
MKTINTKSALLIGGLFSLLAVAVLLVIYLVPGTTDSRQNDTLTTQDDPYNIFFGQSRYRTFSSEKLGLTFNYPASWGPIQVVVKEPEESGDSQYRTEALLLVKGTAFLSAVTEGNVPGRDAWWGDVAKDAWTEQDIRLWCDTLPQRTNAYDQPKDACEILINAEGVTFVRLKGDVDYFGKKTEDARVYITHHQGHTFYGVALSNQNLFNLEEELGDMDKALQDIANSFRFLN